MANPNAGDVLTYNGSQWLNQPGVQGSFWVGGATAPAPGLAPAAATAAALGRTPATPRPPIENRNARGAAAIQSRIIRNPDALGAPEIQDPPSCPFA